MYDLLLTVLRTLKTTILKKRLKFDIECFTIA